MSDIDIRDERVVAALQQIITLCGGDPSALAGDLTLQMMQTSLRLLQEGHDLGKLKLMTRAMKEMRHAYNIFGQYPNVKRVSIFGSARTPEGHRDYLAAQQFGVLMADLGWMCITGAANGIMKAGMEGSQKEGSFGLSIRLPFEIPTNSWIEGDPKLMMFRYFFTRKLMFISYADAVAAFPGGFGTLDELFEVLTLMQTGKSNIIPLVLIEGVGGVYWQEWKEYIDQHLMANGWVSREDEHFYHIAHSPEDAAQHVQKFYSVYHSSRYVKEMLVIRLKTSLTEVQIEELNDSFPQLIQKGKITASQALPEESDNLELPRLVFVHTRNDFGLLRALIDKINDHAKAPY
jgi:uncharacterized protein (TIGR00730 family)